MEQPAPSAAQYADALRQLPSFSAIHVQMVRAHFHAPDRTITATQMARALGHERFHIANLFYGRLARMVGEQLKSTPHSRLNILVEFEKRNGEWHWLMRPEVAEALELLGWVDSDDVLLPEEIDATTSLVEGNVRRVEVNAFERNAEARRRCLTHYGTTCCICGFDFEKAYGEVAAGFIHVHHIHPLASVGKEYSVDPVRDLRPVCPNCHAVLHRQLPPYSIEEVKIMLREAAERLDC